MTPAPFPARPSALSPTQNARAETPPEPRAGGHAFTIGVTADKRSEIFSDVLERSLPTFKKLIDERAETIERDIYTWRVRFDNLFRN